MHSKILRRTKVLRKIQPNHRRSIFLFERSRCCFEKTRSSHREKKRIVIYIEISRCLFTELCTMSDQSTTGRNLYSNALSISIIGEELPRTHNGETIALSATSSDLQGVLRNVCSSANAGSLSGI